MNKNDLIKLKEILESTKQEYTPILKMDKYFNEQEEQTTYQQGAIMNISEIQKKINTEFAIKKIISNFETVIYYYHENFQKFDTITITPCIYPLINIKSLNNNDEDESIATLKTNPEILEDIVLIDLYQLQILNKGRVVSEIAESEYITNYDHTTKFLVSLKDLKKGLSLKDLELTGLNTTTELLENNYPAAITLEFPKSKKHLLEKN